MLFRQVRALRSGFAQTVAGEVQAMGVVHEPVEDGVGDGRVAAFDELKQSIRDIEFLSDPTAGEVRIAAPASLGTGLVATIIDRLTKRHPRVVCHWVVDATYGAVEDRKVDLMITRIVAPISEDHMDAEVLYTDPLFVVAATKNPWSHISAAQREACRSDR